MTPKTALLLGATGLIGSHLLHLLLDSRDYQTVVVITRRSLPDHPKLRQVLMEDFDQLPKLSDAFAGVEDVFCCLGTTIRKAGTQEKFRKVDYDYPVTAARLAKEAGVRRYLLVSSMGANSHAKVFYSRVKGETEETIRKLQLPAVAIMRPSLLLGKRAEFRFGERIAEWISRPILFLFRGPLFKYRPVEARDVAAVMLRMGQMFLPGVHTYENDQIHRLAAGTPGKQ